VVGLLLPQFWQKHMILWACCAKQAQNKFLSAFECKFDVAGVIMGGHGRVQKGGSLCENLWLCSIIQQNA
jgi:hypothetical protein